MIHAFLLVVLIEGKTVSKDAYFRNINECLYFARSIAKQGNNITSYCVPKFVNPNKVKVY